MVNKVQLTITLDKLVDEELTTISKNTSTPKNELINEMIVSHIEDNYTEFVKFVIADDIDYSIRSAGDAGSVYVDVNGTQYEFNFYEDEANESGDRYIEISDDTNNQDVATIQGAYNINSIDVDEHQDEALEVEYGIKEKIASAINDYLHEYSHPRLTVFEFPHQ